MRKFINHHIPEEALGTYYTLPFSVPAGLSSVAVAYEYEGGTVDLGLTDHEQNFLGWSGSGRSRVYVGPVAATPGYRMTEITAGTWHIIIGAYKIPPGGLNVKYTIEFSYPAPRWLGGDLHIHSDASDGQHDIPTLAKKAQKKGLDFIAIANHNNYCENFHLPKIPGLTIIPAVEWTHYRSHINFFGVPAPFDSFVANGEDEMRKIVAEAKSRGALVSANHPLDGNCPYLWESTDHLDMIEVWNAPMRNQNVQAIAWWHRMLQGGRKIPIVGGSDFHRNLHPARIGHPTTRVLASSQAAGDILDALKQGHSYITATVGGVQLELKAGEFMMGDTIKNSESLFINAIGLGGKLQLVTSEGVACEWRQNKLPAIVNISPEWKFAYLIARNIFGRIKAISNPIYF